MRIYIAGRYSRRVEFQDFANQLKEIGHTITSRWLDGRHDGVDDAQCAKDDFEDVKSADVVISFTEEPRCATRGGRHVEFGLALAWGKPCIMIGDKKEHVFHSLPGVMHCSATSCPAVLQIIESMFIARRAAS